MNIYLTNDGNRYELFISPSPPELFNGSFQPVVPCLWLDNVPPECCPIELAPGEYTQVTLFPVLPFVLSPVGRTPPDIE